MSLPPAAAQDICASAAVEEIDAESADQRVRAGSAIQGVVAGRAIQAIIPGERGQNVVSIFALDDVVRRSSGQRVVRIAAVDVRHGPFPVFKGEPRRREPIQPVRRSAHSFGVRATIELEPKIKRPSIEVAQKILPHFSLG